MATKASPKKSGVKSAENKKSAFSKDGVVLAALKLSSELGWGLVTLHDIALETGYSLDELYDHFEDKSDILAALGRMIDRKTLSTIKGVDVSLSPRDRLFDVLMARFDVLNEYRDGVIGILSSFRSDPKQLVVSLPHLCRSMTWMMEAAGMETYGMKGAAKVFGLSVLYLDAVRVWMEDDSADMAKTMAALDRNLGRAEQAANTLGF